MALFDSLIDDIASRFGLGPTATPLVRETLKLILGSPDGLNGFIGRLTAAGLGSVVQSWLGATDATTRGARWFFGIGQAF